MFSQSFFKPHPKQNLVATRMGYKPTYHDLMTDDPFSPSANTTENVFDTNHSPHPATSVPIHTSPTTLLPSHTFTWQPTVNDPFSPSYPYSNKENLRHAKQANNSSKIFDNNLFSRSAYEESCWVKNEQLELYEAKKVLANIKQKLNKSPKKCKEWFSQSENRRQPRLTSDNLPAAATLPSSEKS